MQFGKVLGAMEGQQRPQVVSRPIGRYLAGGHMGPPLPKRGDGAQVPLQRLEESQVRPVVLHRRHRIAPESDADVAGEVVERDL